MTRTLGRIDGDVAVRSRDVWLDDCDAVIVRGIPRGSLEQVIFRVDALHALEARGVTCVNGPRALEIGLVTAFDTDGETARIRVEWQDPALAPLLIPKGSVAVDGVSLTVAALDRRAFEVMVIPHTLERTTLGRLKPGRRVNLEMDVIGKYVLRALSVREESR